MSTRLNRYNRGKILTAAMSATFDERERLLNVREGELAARVYALAIPKKAREAIEIVPREFFQTSSHFYVNLEGWKVKLEFYLPDGKTKDYKIIQCGWRCNNSNYNGNPTVNDMDLRNEYEKLDLERRTLKEETDDAKCKLNALLQSVTTFKRLREIWPEGGIYYEPFDLVTSSNLPVSIDDINKSFGLPRIAATSEAHG